MDEIGWREGERRSEDGGHRLSVFWKWGSIDGGAVLA